MVDNEPLILDFLEWLSREPRSYADVMDSWRTSCPRLTVWEDAMDRGLVARHARDGCSPLILVSEAGRNLLVAAGRAAKLASRGGTFEEFSRTVS